MLTFFPFELFPYQPCIPSQASPPTYMTGPSSTLLKGDNSLFRGNETEIRWWPWNCNLVTIWKESHTCLQDLPCIWRNVISQKYEKPSLIRAEHDEIGFERVGFEVSAGYLCIDVQRKVKNMVWNSGDGFGQNTKPCAWLVLFLTPDISLCISHLQIQVGQKAATALKAKHGTNYKVGSSVDILCKYLFFTSSVVSKSQKKSVDFGEWGGQKRERGVPGINRKFYKSKWPRIKDSLCKSRIMLSRDKVWAQRKKK